MTTIHSFRRTKATTQGQTLNTMCVRVWPSSSYSSATPADTQPTLAYRVTGPRATSPSASPRPRSRPADTKAIPRPHDRASACLQLHRREPARSAAVELGIHTHGCARGICATLGCHVSTRGSDVRALRRWCHRARGSSRRSRRQYACSTPSFERPPPPPAAPSLLAPLPAPPPLAVSSPPRDGAAS